jgi:F-type H+-transporting ATPase subunit b
MLQNGGFWVGVAFFLFLAIAWKMGAFKTMTSGLDARGKRIRAELDEARRLREEAAAVLADYQRRRGEAEREAADLVANAREEAERIAREAHERMADFVTRRTAAAEAKIAQAEVQAQQQVRSAAADAAIRISETVLTEQMRSGAGQELIGRSLTEIRGKLNA